MVEKATTPQTDLNEEFEQAINLLAYAVRNLERVFLKNPEALQKEIEKEGHLGEISKNFIKEFERYTNQETNPFFTFNQILKRRN